MEAEFSELVGETIISFEEVECPPGFWGDSEERYEIKTASGKVFYMQTSGGINIFGFPGSQSHNVSIENGLTPYAPDLGESSASDSESTLTPSG